MNLASAGARITMVVRGSDLAKLMSAYLVDRLSTNPRVEIRLETQVAELQAMGIA